MEQLLNQKQAAEMLGISVRTLERARVDGNGCRYIKLGRLVKYRPSDLTAWVNASVRASTSDIGEVA